jgi:hypothetical protein
LVLTEHSKSAATSPLRLLRISATTTAMFACLAVPALAQATPDVENGRYTLTPMSGGFLRLDTRTGVVSNCGDKGTGWACYALPEERAALDKEIGRLLAENEKLKAQLAAREPIASGRSLQALPKADSLRPGEPNAGVPEAGTPKAATPKAGTPKAGAPKADEPKSTDANRNSIEIPLPSDRDMDRMMSFVERAWRRLIEMADRVRRDTSGGI